MMLAFTKIFLIPATVILINIFHGGNNISVISAFVPSSSIRHPRGRFIVDTLFHTSIPSTRGVVEDADSDGISRVDEPLPQEQENNPQFQKRRRVDGIVDKSAPLNEIVSNMASISLQRAEELIEIGSVWLKMDYLSKDDILGQYDSSGSPSGSNLVYADLPRGWRQGWNDEAIPEWYKGQNGAWQQPSMQSDRYRRVLASGRISEGTSIRIYVNPKRFPACYEFSSSGGKNDDNGDSHSERLLHEDTTYIIVDKPPMLPVQPDSSNYVECCPNCVGEFMGPFYVPDDDNPLKKKQIPRPLICHRVDSCVGGCVVLSKDTYGQARFSEMQRDRQIKKVYLAVTTKPVPLGRHVHWMWKSSLRRGQGDAPPCQLVSHKIPLTRKKAKNWVRCVLEVASCEPIEITTTDHYDGDQQRQQHYQSSIRLVTGRKHQVRSQLSSLGCSIIGDTLYGPVNGMTLDDLDQSVEEEKGRGVDVSLEREEMAMMRLEDAFVKCRAPTTPIGLQAHAIFFAGVKAKAGAPWWRTGQ